MIKVPNFKKGAIVVSLALVPIAFWFWRAKPYCLNGWIAFSVIIVALGIACNIWAVCVNNGKMPVRMNEETYLMLVGRVLTSPRHKFMDSETRCQWLCDIMPVPVVNSYASIGDVFLLIGCVSWFGFVVTRGILLGQF